MTNERKLRDWMLMRAMGSLAAVVAVALLLAGCRDIDLSEASTDEWLRKNGSMTFRGDEIGADSRNFLLARQLSKDYDRRPGETIYRVYREYLDGHERRHLKVLAELCYAAGTNAGNGDRKIGFHAAAAYFAYQYLFGERFRGEELPRYAPDAFVVARFYNCALDTLIEYLSARGLAFNSEYSLPAAAGLNLRFETPRVDLPCPADKTTKLMSCYRYISKGFYVYAYTPGIGTPLIARAEKLPVLPKPFKAAPERSVPTTFFLRMGEAKSDRVPARIELYDTLRTDTVRVGDMGLPLSLDYTTPLAYDLREPPFIDGIVSMFNPDTFNQYGLFAFNRVTPDRIPVVFVHGLMSNPRTWAQMGNILLNDPNIRHNYQFWFFTYSTGNPVPYSAYLFREALKAAEANFKTPEAAANFNNMVIVSHSMGGLLAKTAIQNSGDRLKGAILPSKAVTQKALAPEERKLVEDILTYQQLVFVKTVVFMATPHHGSEMATWVIARWASSYISLPAFFNEYARKVQKMLHPLLDGDGLEDIRVDNGLDNLAPENKTLRAMAEVPFPTNVDYFTICGNKRAVGVPGGTDGIVPYWSSHLDSARDEVIVESGHSVHKNAMAIEETREILSCHLRELGRIK